MKILEILHMFLQILHTVLPIQCIFQTFLILCCRLVTAQLPIMLSKCCKFMSLLFAYFNNKCLQYVAYCITASAAAATKRLVCDGI